MTAAKSEKSGCWFCRGCYCRCRCRRRRCRVVFHPTYSSRLPTRLFLGLFSDFASSPFHRRLWSSTAAASQSHSAPATASLSLPPTSASSTLAPLPPLTPWGLQPPIAVPSGIANHAAAPTDDQAPSAESAVSSGVLSIGCRAGVMAMGQVVLYRTTGNLVYLRAIQITHPPPALRPRLIDAVGAVDATDAWPSVSIPSSSLAVIMI